MAIESDSLKRALIVLATAGKTTPSRRHKLDALEILFWLSQCFPTRDHKVMTVKLALERLNRRGWILAVPVPGQSPQYQLTRSGLIEAKHFWSKRVRLHYSVPKPANTEATVVSEQASGLATSSATVLAIIQARHRETSDSERCLAA